MWGRSSSLDICGRVNTSSSHHGSPSASLLSSVAEHQNEAIYDRNWTMDEFPIAAAPHAALGNVPGNSISNFFSRRRTRVFSHQPPGEIWILAQARSRSQPNEN